MARNPLFIDGREIPYHIDAFERFVGHEIGQSEWLELDQERVNLFARATEDMNPLHVDPEWATEEGPFGGPVAHGFLTLSLLSHLSYDANVQPDGVDYGINVGFDRVRFLAPVKVGDRIRCRFLLKEVKPQQTNRWSFQTRCTIEIESTGKAALSAVWMVLFIKEQAEG